MVAWEGCPAYHLSNPSIWMLVKLQMLALLLLQVWSLGIVAVYLSAWSQFHINYLCLDFVSLCKFLAVLYCTSYFILHSSIFLRSLNSAVTIEWYFLSLQISVFPFCRLDWVDAFGSLWSTNYWFWNQLSAMYART